MTHNYVIISASLFYFLINFFVLKFRLFFENHMVLKKRNVNVFQAVPLLLVSGSYQLLVLYQEIDILANIEYLKTKKSIFVCRYYHISSDSGPTRVV